MSPERSWQGGGEGAAGLQLCSSAKQLQPEKSSGLQPSPDLINKLFSGDINLQSKQSSSREEHF